jgi:U32 family peptidase
MRPQPELLSPAGSMECFFAAVEHGADAIYFGLNNFSARAGAQNFSLDDASKAIAYAHGRSVKVYIALNTLLKTREMERVVDYLIALEELHPDALILQDLGLLSLIQSQFPHFSLHASTQMAIHTIAGVKQLEKMGFNRIVLARELSIEEIKDISRKTSVETEVFVHGALCYSYSGLCLFSSMIGGRSGNRGRCAQPCRMHYRSRNGRAGYLFSMKDLLALPYINDLINAGVRSFKIEGRMKSPEYVAVVTNAYRQAIDGKLQNYDAAIHRIKTVFSRETTHSYLSEKNDCQNRKTIQNRLIKAADMINPSYPANIGSYAGKVVKSGKGRITIKADAEIGVRDLLQIFEDNLTKPTLLPVKDIMVKGKRVFGIKTGDIAAITSERQYMQGTQLYLLSSRKIREMFAPKIPKKLVPTKIPVDLHVRIKACGIHIKGIVQHVSYSKDYPVNFGKGIHKILQEEHIKGCFSRLGETPFTLSGIHTTISEDLFIPLSVLNDIRRDYFQNLSETWMEAREYRCKNIKEWMKNKIPGFNGLNDIRLSLKIDKFRYLHHIPLEKIYKIYIVLTSETFEDIKRTEKDDKIVLSLPAIMRDKGDEPGTYRYFQKIVNESISQGFRQFQISNPGAISLFEGKKDVVLYADYPLYCLNPLSAIKLKELGFCRYTLSPEDDEDNLRNQFSPDADMILYQDTPLFGSETCVWANREGICPGKDQCGFKQVFLENEYGDRFLAVNDDCRTVVIHEKPFSLIHYIPKLSGAGQVSFRIDLCYRDYTPEMIQDIFSKIQNKHKIKNSLTGNFERGLL